LVIFYLIVFICDKQLRTSTTMFYSEKTELITPFSLRGRP